MSNKVFEMRQRLTRWYVQNNKNKQVYYKYNDGFDKETAETLAEVMNQLFNENEALTQQNKRLNQQLDKIPTFIKKIFGVK